MREHIQELADLGTVNVNAVTEKIIANVIEEIRRSKRVFAQFYKPNYDLVERGGTAVEFPKKGSGISATFDVSPGTGVSTSAMTFDAVTIPIKKGALGLGFQGEAIRQANRDVLTDSIKEAGEVWADTLDQVALEALFPTASTSSAAAATVDASLFIGIKSASGLTNTSIKVTDTTGNSIIFTGGATLTYYYIPTTTEYTSDTIGGIRVTSTANSFSARDVLKIKADVEGNNFNPDVIIMHPDRFEEIMYDPATKFMEAPASTGKEPYNGEIGRLWGITTIVSTRMPKYGITVIDSANLGWEVNRMPLELGRDDYTGMSMDVLYFWGFGEVNYGVNNAKAYAAVAMKGTFTPTA